MDQVYRSFHGVDGLELDLGKIAKSRERDMGLSTREKTQAEV